MTKDFEKYLRNKNLADSTVKSYLRTAEKFEECYGVPTKKNLKTYREWLLVNYKPQTVNLRIRAMNCYLECMGKEKWKLRFLRIQQRQFVENVISEDDYVHLKDCLKSDEEWLWYFVIRFFTATGVRVSELIQIKVEDVKVGHLDLHSKGEKVRRVYIPKTLQEETLRWLHGEHKENGPLFLNKYGNPITTRGISGQLKKIALRYHVDPNVVYPHSFRHRFAKNFLEHNHDIAFLADIMGHENIETTRIYLKKTGAEQKEIIDNVVNW